MVRNFDLNIEQILEAWQPHHAVREIIANALDEQLLTQTRDIQIYKNGRDTWCVQDFGRGLKYTHLTQNENDEKLSNPHVIGKFGIGLKDALATLNRHGINVTVKSQFGDIRLVRSQKQGFQDIITLHASIDEPSEPELVGTKFLLSGISDDEIEQAKNLFLRFSGERIVEQTQYGEIVESRDDVRSIYINGVKVASEENFLFSYNITSLNAAIKKALNRERSNVGRSAYTERVKAILLSSRSTSVAKALAVNLQNYSTGNHSDELGWLAVQEHAVRILNQSQRVVFVTPEELMLSPDLVDDARNSGYEIITIPDSLEAKIRGTEDFEGNIVTDLSRFADIYNDSFEFMFVEARDLTHREQVVFGYTNQIFDIAGGRPRAIKGVRVSETMRRDVLRNRETLGIWDASSGLIIVKRSQLSSLASYAGTLLHEALHAKSGYGDVSRDFETELTKLIGVICANGLDRSNRSGWLGRLF